MFGRKLIISACLALATAFATGCGPSAIVVQQEPAKPVISEKPVVVDQVKKAQEMRETLAARRAKMIERLEEYKDAGVFPKNRVSKTMINVFRDEDGHLCAVANLIHLDGLDELVDRTAKNDNFAKVAEKLDGGLHDWVLTSGLTREEVAFIQAPYMPVRPVVDFEAQERARLQAHFTEVLSQLRENTDSSLDLAMSRVFEKVDDRVVARSFATPPGA